MVIHEGKEISLNIGKLKTARVTKWLGSGGFADVWLVKDSKTDKSYVLKHIQIKTTIKDKEKFIIRIKNEASVDIPSEYVVKILGMGEFAPNNYGILFEYIVGESFSDWIKDNKMASWAEKKKLFINILKGVNHAHQLNIIHRDLKPDNILITDKGQPKIIDFGLAKFKDKSVTLTGEFGGTLPYSDPEALLNGIKYVDCRCDIYALGVILHELVQGANFWISEDIEFGEFVGHLKAGKKNILEILDGFSFPDDHNVEKVLAQSTMFESVGRLDAVNSMIELLGGVPEVTPDFVVDHSISSPVLIIEDGSAKGSINMIAISDGGERRLGRLNLDATNNTISKNQAVIRRKGNRYFIFDAKSKNGTFVNGKKIGRSPTEPIEIKHTDRIRFADLWTRFVFLKS